MSRSNIEDVRVQFQHQTEAAVCVRANEAGADLWIPKSVCEINPSEPMRGQIVTLTSDEDTLADNGLT
jgi:hypothetical protein